MNEQLIKFDSFIDKHKNTRTKLGKNIIISKNEINDHFTGFTVDTEVKKIIKKDFEKILFGFRGSLIVFEDGVISSFPGSNGKKHSFNEVTEFTVKKTGFFSKGNLYDKNSNKVSLSIGNDLTEGTKVFEEFQNILSNNKNFSKVKKSNPKNEIENTSSDETYLKFEKLTSYNIVDLGKNVIDFVKTLPQKLPEKILDIKTIENGNKKVFGRNPYKGWNLPSDNICGFKSHRVLFDEYCVEYVRYSYPDNHKNPKLYYIEIINFYKSKLFFSTLRNSNIDESLINYIENKFNHIFKKWVLKTEKKIKIGDLLESLQIYKLNKSKTSFLRIFDKDGNGELDTIEIKDDFDKLVKKHQSKIIDIDRNYIKHFVKISNDQKIKRENLQKIFESISKKQNQENLEDTIELLRERIHSYELILFHSLSMVTCLVDDDMFTFYEIYESFDKLKIFKSDHENEISEKLSSIEMKFEMGIFELMNSIRSMERGVINELGHLRYVSQNSFKELSSSVTKQLSSVNSSIKFNNLLTGIQTYQMYKVNKNTKSLRG